MNEAQEFAQLISKHPELKPDIKAILAPTPYKPSPEEAALIREFAERLLNGEPEAIAHANRIGITIAAD